MSVLSVDEEEVTSEFDRSAASPISKLTALYDRQPPPPPQVQLATLRRRVVLDAHSDPKRQPDSLKVGHHRLLLSPRDRP